MIEELLLPKVVEQARREASNLGVTLDDCFLELVSQGLDPRERDVDHSSRLRVWFSKLAQVEVALMCVEKLVSGVAARVKQSAL